MLVSQRVSKISAFQATIRLSGFLANLHAILFAQALLFIGTEDFATFSLVCVVISHAPVL